MKCFLIVNGVLIFLLQTLIRSLSTRVIAEGLKYIETRRSGSLTIRRPLKETQLYQLRKLKGKQTDFDAEIYHLQNSSFEGFRSLCLSIYFSNWFEPMVFGVIILNFLHVSMDVYFLLNFASVKYKTIMNSLAAFFIIFYALEIIIKICALKWNLYKRSFWNKIDLSLSIFAILEGALDLALAQFPELHSLPSHIRILIVLRFLKHFRIIINVFFSTLLLIRNHASSELYHAYDIGQGFLFATESVLKNINVIVDFGPCVKVPVSVCEKNIKEVMGEKKDKRFQIYNKLPNSDSMFYFDDTQTSFCDYLTTSQTLGLLGFLERSASVTTAVCEKDCKLIEIPYSFLDEAVNKSETLMYSIWRSIAIRISLQVLKKHRHYKNYSDEDMNLKLQKAILPNFSNVTSWEIPSVVQDVVLIQGRVKSIGTQVEFEAPTYIPSTAHLLYFLDDVKRRPPVVLLLLLNPKFNFLSSSHWITVDEINSAYFQHKRKQKKKKL